MSAESPNRPSNSTETPYTLRPDWWTRYSAEPAQTIIDPDKPSLPYIPGLSLQIHRHRPPPSFYESYRKKVQPRPEMPRDYLRETSHSQAVIENPPLETKPPANPETARLVITAPISIGAVRGAQIVACTIHSQADGNIAQPSSFQAAAKIYDPLYYSFQTSSEKQDVVYDADQDYSNEAAAYELLHKAGLTGATAPQYYGSWTFCLPIKISNSEVQHTRPIRLILMEQLHGTTIRNTRIRNNPIREMGLDAFHYPEDYRLEILARAMDGFVRQLQCGVDQRDFAGRNVVLVPNGTDLSTAIQSLDNHEYHNTSEGLSLPRVVIIDYNHATVDNEQHSSRPLLPENPISIFWNSYFWEDFGGWVPHEWEDGERQREWLIQRFHGDGQRQLYQSVRENVLHRLHEYS